MANPNLSLRALLFVLTVTLFHWGGVKHSDSGRVESQGRLHPLLTKEGESSFTYGPLYFFRSLNPSFQIRVDIDDPRLLEVWAKTIEEGMGNGDARRQGKVFAASLIGTAIADCLWIVTTCNFLLNDNLKLGWWSTGWWPDWWRTDLLLSWFDGVIPSLYKARMGSKVGMELLAGVLSGEARLKRPEMTELMETSCLIWVSKLVSIMVARWYQMARLVFGSMMSSVISYDDDAFMKLGLDPIGLGQTIGLMLMFHGNGLIIAIIGQTRKMQEESDGLGLYGGAHFTLLLSQISLGFGKCLCSTEPLSPNLQGKDKIYVGVVGAYILCLTISIVYRLT